MDQKTKVLAKCAKCSQVFSFRDFKSHHCVEVKLENESTGDVEYKEDVEFLESDYEGDEIESSDEEIADLLTSDWTVEEEELLLDTSIQILEEGDVIDSETFWANLMTVFDQNGRWPLFVVKAKLKQLRELFESDPSNFQKKVYKKLVKLSGLVKENSVNEKVSSEPDTKNFQSPPSGNSAYDDDEDYEQLRWTGRDIHQLIRSYKGHLRLMMSTPSHKGKRKIWEKIASEIEMSGMRGCGPYSARMKMMNLKKTWMNHKDKKKITWPYFSHISQIMKLEKREQKIDSDSEYVSEPSSEEDEESSKKRFKATPDQPEWFLRFRQEARRRHVEKMKIKMKLLEVLDSFVDKMNK